MRKTSLIELLQTFTPDEIKDFGEFVSSVYFNKNKNVVKLYGYLKKQYPLFSEKKLSKEYISNKLYTRKRYSDVFMRQMIHLLTKLAEEYLVYTRLSGSGIDKNILLLAELNDRKLDRMFEKEMNIVKSTLSAETAMDEMFYISDFRAKREMNDFKSHRYILHSKETEKQYLSESESLTIYFIINVLRRYIYLITESKVIAMDYSREFLDDVIMLTKKFDFDRVPIVALYLTLLAMVSEGADDKHYFNLKTMLEKDKNLFKQNTLYELYMSLLNYCSLKTYRGELQYYDEMYELYRKMLAGSIIFSAKTGEISLVNFKNIVITGVSLKKFKWTQDFISSTYTRLPLQERDNSYNYCMGVLSFETGDFESALKFAANVKYEDIYNKLEIRVLNIRIYFELSMTGELSYLTENFRRFLSANKLIPPYIYLAHRNFIKQVELAKKAKLKNDKSAAAELIKIVSETEYIVSRKWLISKLQEI